MYIGCLNFFCNMCYLVVWGPPPTYCGLSIMTTAPPLSAGLIIMFVFSLRFWLSFFLLLGLGVIGRLVIVLWSLFIKAWTIFFFCILPGGGSDLGWNGRVFLSWVKKKKKRPVSVYGGIGWSVQQSLLRFGPSVWYKRETFFVGSPFLPQIKWCFMKG